MRVFRLLFLGLVLGSTAGPRMYLFSVSSGAFTFNHIERDWRHDNHHTTYPASQALFYEARQPGMYIAICWSVVTTSSCCNQYAQSMGYFLLSPCFAMQRKYLFLLIVCCFCPWAYAATVCAMCLLVYLGTVQVYY